MHTRSLVVLALVVLFTEAQGLWDAKREEKCINYYQTGKNFDLNQLNDHQWHAVYFWPPIQRQRETCGLYNFRSMSDDEVDNATENCEDVIDESETAIQATYRNSTGKLVNVMYFGDQEVKTMMRSCDKVYKYLFVRINDDYVTGINCSKGGRGILLAKYLPTYKEVQGVVEGIWFMRGREGGPDCPLR
ncbi:uncharacterized protein [Battus philenor]|uniref:uncharacterized protein n=1 Tax=Battus philenor TaxID=42288 RepID=UPI0035D11950